MNSPPHDKSEACDSCGFETTELTLTSEPVTSQGDLVHGWLCVVCRSTFAGNVYFHPMELETTRILRSMAWCTNHIVDSIKKESL